jgi:hypothetical protein
MSHFIGRKLAAAARFADRRFRWPHRMTSDAVLRTAVRTRKMPNHIGRMGSMRVLDHPFSSLCTGKKIVSPRPKPI